MVSFGATGLSDADYNNFFKLAILRLRVETGSILCRTALWDCFGNAQDTGLKFVSQKNLIVQFETKSTQSQAQTQNPNR